MLDDNKITLDFGLDEENESKPTENPTGMKRHATLDFGDIDRKQSIIKVIGVGGGGGNAVNHMYREGIHDVTFVVCNTDQQALNDSPVPVHLQLGNEGLGAGNKPEKGKKAAEESVEEIKEMLTDGTKMAFITAGMGGGTGTGAAPVVARISKELDILTVGIVTIPFKFEGKQKIDKALDGVEEMAKHVDALLVINNERLRDIYSDFSVEGAFGKADDTLSVAAKSIAEIITTHGLINLDFNDVKTVLKDGGVAIMSTGYGEGDNRIRKAIENALHSPLLKNNDIFNSKKILLSINFYSGGDPTKGLMMEEMNEVTEFMDQFDNDFEIKWGLSNNDEKLGERVKVTILATGFGIEDIEGMNDHTKKRTQEEIDRKAREAEEEDKRRQRREKYYGGGDGKTAKKTRAHYYIFRPEDLDNEDVIMLVENNPTYLRTRQMIADIQKQSQGEKQEEITNEDNNTASGVISFA